MVVGGVNIYSYFCLVSYVDRLDENSQSDFFNESILQRIQGIAKTVDSICLLKVEACLWY